MGDSGAKSVGFSNKIMIQQAERFGYHWLVFIRESGKKCCEIIDSFALFTDAHFFMNKSRWKCYPLGNKSKSHSREHK